MAVIGKNRESPPRISGHLHLSSRRHCFPCFPQMNRLLNNRRAVAVITGVSADGRLDEIESLYRTRFSHFLRVAIAITGNHDVALEAVQDGFGDAIRSRGSFRGQGTLEAWIWRLVVNASRDARTSTTHAPPVLLADVEERRNGRAESAAVRAAVAGLPERQRLVLFLRYYADLDYRAIGEALGIATGTVSATLNQAHRALRRAIEEVEA